MAGDLEHADGALAGDLRSIGGQHGGIGGRNAGDEQQACHQHDGQGQMTQPDGNGPQHHVRRVAIGLDHPIDQGQGNHRIEPLKGPLAQGGNQPGAQVAMGRRHVGEDEENRGGGQMPQGAGHARMSPIWLVQRRAGPMKSWDLDAKPLQSLTMAQPPAKPQTQERIRQPYHRGRPWPSKPSGCHGHRKTLRSAIDGTGRGRHH